jgi:hypothetical protein
MQIRIRECTGTYLGNKAPLCTEEATIKPKIQGFGSGSAIDLSSGSAFRIRIQQLIKLAPKAKKNAYNLELFDKF